MTSQTGIGRGETPHDETERDPLTAVPQTPDAATAGQTTVEPARQQGSSKLLIVMGTLWLLLAAALLVYQFSSPPRVEINWSTATEQNTAGFYVYRSTDPEGEFELLNGDAMINAEGSAVSGAEYVFIDDTVEPGNTYYYVLEEVEFDSSRNRYMDDLDTYHVPRVVWWAVILTAVSTIIGLALLITGLKEERNL